MTGSCVPAPHSLLRPRSTWGGARPVLMVAVTLLLAIVALLVAWGRQQPGPEAARTTVDQVDPPDREAPASRPRPSPSPPPPPPGGMIRVGRNLHGFEEYRNLKDGSILVYIPAGSFVMGLGSERQRTTLDGFLIGTLEVTNRQFRRFVKATGHDAGSEWQDHARKSGDDHPVVCVSWHDAAAYCQWAGLRLPSEAEWEKAAHGERPQAYPWGDEWRPDLCNSSESGRGMTTPAGFFTRGASPYGVLDMAGNVGEWCSDWYHTHQKPGASSARVLTTAPSRICRGGSWNSATGYCLTTCRDYGLPDDRGPFLGFRAAKSAP